MPVRAQQPDTVDVLSVTQGRLTANILGVSPLIINRLSEKAKHELLLPAGRKTAADRAANLKHDPYAEFRASPYTLPGQDEPTLLAMPTTVMNGAILTAALDMPGLTRTRIGRLVNPGGEWMHIWGAPELHMSIVRQADINHTPDIRTRTIVPRWACRLEVTFVVPLIRPQSVTNLLAAAGITAGIGDWRPEKGKGGYGRFELVDASHPRWAEFELLMETGGRQAQIAAMADPHPYDELTEELLSWFVETATAKGHNIATKVEEEAIA